MKHIKMNITLYKTTYWLLVFISLSGLYSCSVSDKNKKSANNNKDTSSLNVTNNISKNDSIENYLLKIYYFHTSFRCHTCNMIEKHTKDAIYDNFSKELENEKIIFKIINIELDENKHYVDKYKLITKSVIVSKVLEDTVKEWKNLDKIWFLHKEPNKFKKYIVDEIKKYQ